MPASLRSDSPIYLLPATAHFRPERLPSFTGIRKQLSKSKDFDKVWSTDYSNRLLSLQNFQYFELKKGDLIVWDVPDSIEKGGISHCAIAGENRKVIYAGSDQSSNGCGYCDIVYFTGTMKLPMSYGTPTAIYRYKHMTK